MIVFQLTSIDHTNTIELSSITYFNTDFESLMFLSLHFLVNDCDEFCVFVTQKTLSCRAEPHSCTSDILLGFFSGRGGGCSLAMLLPMNVFLSGACTRLFSCDIHRGTSPIMKRHPPRTMIGPQACCRVLDPAVGML